MKKNDEVKKTDEVINKPLKRHFITAFWITLVVALGLMITGFFMPPKGKIDGSVVTGAGVIFLWPALAFAAKAIDDGKTAKFKTNVASLTVGNHNGDE